MNEISFRQTSNIFLNGGIVALRWYLEFHKSEFSFEYTLESTPEILKIKSDNLLKLLEEVYYLMGGEIYDTSGKNARDKIEKYFFSKGHAPKGFHKMKTYGLGELITNDPTPKANPKGRKIKFKNLLEEDSPFAFEVAKFYEETGLKIKGFQLINGEILANPDQKGDSEIFIDAPYTKTTKIEFDKKYLEIGDQSSYLTGEGYKKLLDTTNTSPFLSGLDNFSSYLTPTSQKISWKTLFLSQFSPKLCLYKYISGLDSLVCYFFISDNLENTYKLYLQNSSFYSDQNELIEGNYMANFKVYNVSPRKDDEQRLKSPADFTERHEILFILIYTFYKQFLFSKGLDAKIAEGDYDPMADFDSELPPISLVSFQADKFANTLRPNAFEQFNNFKFAISLISYLERNGIQFSQVLASLKFLKNSDKNSKNKYRLERQIRNRLLEELLNQKPIISIIHLFCINVIPTCFQVIM